MKGPWAVILCVALAASLGVALTLRTSSPPRATLVVLTAASLRPVMESAAADYEATTGVPVELRFGGSDELVAQIRLTADLAPADLFLPADASYLEGVTTVHTGRPLTEMRAVVLTTPGRADLTWEALTAPPLRLALAEPGTAAIGKLTKSHLQRGRHWDALAPRVAVTTDTVTQSANAVRLGGVDAAIVWDATARQFAPGLVAVPLAELDGVRAEVRVAVLRESRDRGAARAFADWLEGDGGGLPHFARHGFPPPRVPL